MSDQHELAVGEQSMQRGMLDVAQSRAAQEVQAAMVVAKKFPRDENAAVARIMRACSRVKLAEQALYAYPRGNQTVTGPSIRLAEMLAQNWGNLSCGIIELDQQDGVSTMMAYAWDLETNSRVDKVFSVKHIRATRKGAYKLDDPRDVYELTANQGARRMRACILAVIPGDIVEAACIEAERTLAGNNKEPIQDRIRKMVAAFDKLGVGPSRIADRLGHKLEATTETELVQMVKIYKSITDNMATVDEFFPTEDKREMKGSASLADLKPGKAPEARPKPEPKQTAPDEDEDASADNPPGDAPSGATQWSAEDYAAIEAAEAAEAERMADEEAANAAARDSDRMHAAKAKATGADKQPNTPQRRLL